MGYRVKITPRAERDLGRIYHWIQALDSDSAAKWYWGLKDAIGTLRENPKRCPVTPENRNLRQLLYGNRANVYRVIYRVVEKRKEVDIVHIRHSARRAVDKRES